MEQIAAEVASKYGSDKVLDSLKGCAAAVESVSDQLKGLRVVSFEQPSNTLSLKEAATRYGHLLSITITISRLDKRKKPNLYFKNLRKEDFHLLALISLC